MEFSTWVVMVSAGQPWLVHVSTESEGLLIMSGWYLLSSAKFMLIWVQIMLQMFVNNILM